MLWWQVLVYGIHDFGCCMWAGDGEDLRMCLLNHITFSAETAGDDDFAIFSQGFADGIQRFFDCGIDKTAGIDHDKIGIFIRRHNVVTFCAQLCENMLRIDGGFGAAQADETDLMGTLNCCLFWC